MKPLPTEFDADKHHFRQISRDGLVAVFEKSKGGKVRSFETVVIQQRKACVLHGDPVPAHEAMPSSESWGRHGFTYTDRESAFRRAGVLAERQNAPAGLHNANAGHP